MGMVKNELILYGVAAAAAVGAIWYLKGKAGGAVTAVKEFASTKLNPADPNNLAYSSVNQVGADLAGDKNWTLGGALFDLFHDTYDPNAPDTTSANGKTVAANPNYLMGVNTANGWIS